MNILLSFDSLLMLAQGMLYTLFLWLCSAAISLALGISLGIIQCNYLKKSLSSALISSYLFIIRGLPVSIQLLIMYFVIPELLGLSLSAAAAAIIALGICSGAYMTQIIKSGCDGVQQGQWEAAAILGFSPLQTVRFIIMPQVFEHSMPAIVGELDQLIKSTSIVSSIGIAELTRRGMNIIAHDLNPVPVYLTIALLYLALSSILILLKKVLQGRLRYD